MSEDSDANSIRETQAAVGTEPVPKRFWWLKRLLVLSAAFVVSVGLLRWGAGCEANRRLQAELAKYRAAGQPVHPSDFEAQFAAVPDDENAAILLTEAAKAVVTTTNSGVSIFDLCCDRQRCLGAIDGMRELVAANAQVLDLVRRARALPEVAWNLPVTVQGLRTAPWGTHRELARLLWIAAFDASHRHDHAEACEVLQDALHHSEAVESHPTLISSLVAWPTYGLAFEAISEVGAELRLVGQETGERPVGRAADRAQVVQLVEWLLDETRSRATAVRSYHGDRVRDLDTINALRCFGWSGVQSGTFTASPPLRDRLRFFVQYPMLVLDTLTLLDASTVRARAAQEIDWPTAASHFPTRATEPSLLRTMSNPLTWYSDLVFPEHESLGGQLCFKHLAERRMAAIALAVHLYAADHGHRPAELADLVPDYLPNLPADPFVADGATFRYRRAAQGDLLYSIGSDGKDDGGAWVSGERQDVPFHLDGKPESDVVSGREGGDQDENVQDERGKDDQDHAGEGDP